MTDYSETVEELALELSSRLEVGDATVAESPTIETAREVITQALEPREEFQEATTALDPPDEMADLHSDMVELHARIISAQTAFATAAEAASGFEELDESEQARPTERFRQNLRRSAGSSRRESMRPPQTPPSGWRTGLRRA